MTKYKRNCANTEVIIITNKLDFDIQVNQIAPLRDSCVGFPHLYH